jgi:deoxyribose-phosphate aldolase
MGVKASGGVRTYEDAASLIKAGATRIGASAGVKIIQGPGTQTTSGNGSSPSKSY